MDDKNDLLKCCRQAVMYIAEEHYAQCPEIVLASLADLMFHFLHSLAKTTQKFAEYNNRSQSNSIDALTALSSFGFQVPDLIDAYLTSIHQSNTFRVAELNSRPNTFFKPEKSFLRSTILDEEVKKDLGPISGPYFDAKLKWLPFLPAEKTWQSENLQGKSRGKLKIVEKKEVLAEKIENPETNLNLKISRKIFDSKTQNFSENSEIFDDKILEKFLGGMKIYFDELFEKAENFGENQ